MQGPLRLSLSILALAVAAACAAPAPEAKAPAAAAPVASRALYPNETPELRALINQYADRYGVPEDLVQRVVIRESRHNPEARNGPYYGLMQILPATARSMGYEGSPKGLLDPETNLKLRGQVPARRLAGVRRQPGPGRAMVCARLLLRGQAQGSAGRDRAPLSGVRESRRPDQSPSSEPEAARHRQANAGDVARGVGGEEGHRLGHVFRDAGAARRDLGQQIVLERVGVGEEADLQRAGGRGLAELGGVHREAQQAVAEALQEIDRGAYWPLAAGPEEPSLNRCGALIPRDDERLVQVVEEQRAAANGHAADLKVVEIPDDVQWVINKTDGVEHVSEVHRTWE